MSNNDSISDLAPFVATVLRDQALADLHEELTAAKAKLTAAKARTVAVTGLRGQPVYAAADFSTGKAVQNGNAWIVSFVRPGDDDTSGNIASSNRVPFSGGGLEVLVGGVLLCETHEDWDGESSMYMKADTRISIQLLVQKCWILLEILEDGVSDEDWNRLQGVSQGGFHPLAPLGEVLESIPHISFRVEEVVLHPEYIPGLMPRVAVDPSDIEA